MRALPRLLNKETTLRTAVAANIVSIVADLSRILYVIAASLRTALSKCSRVYSASPSKNRHALVITAGDAIALFSEYDFKRVSYCVNLFLLIDNPVSAHILADGSTSTFPSEFFDALIRAAVSI